MASPKLLELVEFFFLEEVKIQGENVPEFGDSFFREVAIVSPVVVLERYSVQEILGIAANKMKRLNRNDILNGLIKLEHQVIIFIDSLKKVIAIYFHPWVAGETTVTNFCRRP